MDLYLPVKPSILIVDDSLVNFSRLADLLQGQYTIKAVCHGKSVLEAALEAQPDLILLDIMTPDNATYDICKSIKVNPLTCQIPIFFLTDEADSESEQIVTAMGVLEYLRRSMNSTTLLSRINARFAEANDVKTMRVNNRYLELKVAQQASQLAAIQNVTILALASLAETRDFETGNHLKRTQQYVRALSERLHAHPRFSGYLSPERIDSLVKCVPLHDIGKVGIPDRILLKPGRFEPDEFEIMKTHPALGRDAIASAQAAVEDDSEFFEIAKQIVYSHHEKWDGSGYPQGLSGDAIPIPARLMALADVYDALISRRVYKSGMPHAQAVHMIVDGRGKHFDPDVVDAFVELGEEFQSMATRFADTDLDMQQKTAYSAMAVA
jgi:putative two-component system response regulator